MTTVPAVITTAPPDADCFRKLTPEVEWPTQDFEGKVEIT